MSCVAKYQSNIFKSRSMFVRSLANHQNQIIWSKSMVTKFYQILQRLVNNRYEPELIWTYLDQHRVHWTLYIVYWTYLDQHRRHLFRVFHMPQDAYLFLGSGMREWAGGGGGGVSPNAFLFQPTELCLHTAHHTHLHYITVYLLQS